MFPHWENPEEMLKVTGLLKKDLKHLGTIRHNYTKYLIRLEVYQTAAGFSINPLPGKWISIERLATLPLPSPHQKITSRFVLTHPRH
jgi:adenine-specific DNA glycosylase